MGSAHQLPYQSSTQSETADGLRFKRIVVKIGTSVLANSPSYQSLDVAIMSELVRQISQLNHQSAEVLIVTSGAIAAGKQVLGQSQTSLGRDIPSRQVLAAIGQSRLIQSYQTLFEKHHVTVAQTLLTINDLSDRQSYLNVRNTLISLLELGVIPILNENDVVAVDEIGEVFGDNDRLSALVANLVDADLLVILTDTDGLYTADPQVDPAASLIADVEKVNATVETWAGKHRHHWARGGMPTKIEAARMVTTSGIPMVLCHGRASDALLVAACGKAVGTLFHPATEKLEARKRWMLSSISHRDGIVVDGGAEQALLSRNSSLLPAGVKTIKGVFQRGDIIHIETGKGQLIACGISNYSSDDITRIRGFHSDHIRDALGYDYGHEVVHRNNLVIV
jgi:glutamate 5-kinase